jgi:hypothetical protein
MTAEQKPNLSEQFQRASRARRPGLLGEFWEFLKHNKKWWLAPILIMLLLLGGLILLGGTAAAPFIYTLF